MGKSIAFVSGKGGTGKTTVAAGISLSLGDIGKKSIFLSFDGCDYTAAALFGVGEQTVGNLSDILSGNCELSNAVNIVKSNTACILPPDRGFKLRDNGYLADLTDELKSVYDFVIIDAPPDIGDGYNAALELADEVVIVTIPDEPSLNAAYDVRCDAKSAGIPAKLVLNRLKSQKTVTYDRDVDNIIDDFSCKLLGLIPDYQGYVLSSTNLIHNKDSEMYDIMQRMANRICDNFMPIKISAKF